MPFRNVKYMQDNNNKHIELRLVRSYRLHSCFKKSDDLNLRNAMSASIGDCENRNALRVNICTK